MFIISGGKGTGKTKALIERAKAEDGIIVCENTIEMRERAYAYGITGLNLISYDDFYDCKVTNYDKPIYIHNINEFIKYNYSEIKGYTLSLN
jgi:hypothetical protein